MDVPGRELLVINLRHVINEYLRSLGYSGRAITFNYPGDSLRGYLGDGDMDALLADFTAYAATAGLPGITVSRYEEQYALTVPPETVKRAENDMNGADIMQKLFALLAKGGGAEDAAALLSEYSDKVSVKRDCSDEYDCAMYFEDGVPSDMVYLLEFAPDHKAVHRMTRRDYERTFGKL